MQKIRYRVIRFAEIILGLIFTVMSLNYFFSFFSLPTPPPEGQAYMGALMETGYFFPVLKTTELVGGLLLLTGTAIPFATLLLAPIIVQIFLFHFFLAPGGLPLAVILVALEISLGVYYWPDFKHLFNVNSTAKATLKRSESGTQKTETQKATATS